MGRGRLSLVLGATIILLSGNSAIAQTKYKLKKSQLVTVSGNKLCGLIKSKWSPVKKSGKQYVIDKKDKARCKTLLSPGTLKKSGLAQIPSASSLLKSSPSASALAVSGTAPVLKNIPTLGAKNVFWNSGVIDSLIATDSPTQQQCEEFFVGPNDGQSAGMLGCYSVQGVGYSFQSILEGGTSTCLMKGLPTRENITAGAVAIVDGSVPNDDISQLFSTPTGDKDRLVKVVISSFQDPGNGNGGGGAGGGQTGFINIHSAKKLATKGNQYAYNLWFCNDGEATASNYEETSVSLGGLFTYKNVNAMQSSKYQNEITAYLTKSGSSVDFDLSKERTASSAGEFQGANFKSAVTVLPTNLIKTKVKETFNGFGRSNYGIASFSGTGLSDFRVQSAALKDIFSMQSMQAGIEFRDTVYVSAPNSQLASLLSEVDIATDPFYTQDGTVTPDFSDKPCSAQADVTISMNFSSPALQQVFMTCQSDRLDNMDFCRSQEMFQAQSKCTPN
jgi:hypothetical protein